MASRIQGITVEIGGDTTKLSKALESVNKSTAENTPTGTADDRGRTGRAGNHEKEL